MFIRKISLEQYKVLEDVEINFEPKEKHSVFPIISINGGGKSTLLQVVFAFLHCAFKENRHEYLKTLMGYFKISKSKDKLDNLISFELEHEAQIINVDFFQCKNGYKGLNFNSIVELQQLKEKKNISRESIQQIQLLNNLKKDLQLGRISPSLVRHELRSFFENAEDENRVINGSIASISKFIQDTLKRIENSLISDSELNELLIKTEAEKNRLTNELTKNNLQYAFHFNGNKNILLYKSNADNEILSKIANKIYFATPNTQVLHFLNDEQLSSLFSNEKYLYSSYEHHVKECQKDVIGLFTYDFSAINLILEAFKKARDDDFKKAMETGDYGSEIQITRKELNKLLRGKSITIDNDFKGVTFKTTESNITLSPKDLSHGELKKLSIYIWLKAKTQDDSVILMDEVEMGLHPTWQHELYDDLQKWGKGNQYILATHSPQIISKSYYKNLAVLKRTDKGATAEQFSEAPLESDLNTIVKTIMGGEYIPKELAELRKQYRTFFENGELETAKAQKIKEQILNYESENSSFFQSIKFEMALR